MAYNLTRQDSPVHNDPYSPTHRPQPLRSPSPGLPLQPYDQRNYAQQDYGLAPPSQQHLQMPMASSDRLAMQPTYSVENIHNSYGHNDRYDDDHRQPLPVNNYSSGDYAISPEEHHDAYFNRPYSPRVQQDYDLTPYDQPPDRYTPGDDNRPILQAPDEPYGPDPDSYQDDPDHEPTPPPQGGGVRRWKTVKEVQLFNGNLVLDCPIPPALLSQVPHAAPPERDEFTHMRYSAATCDPKDFYNERFTLRQRLFAKPRQTELFIVITMYNEDEFLFARTLIGVMKNIDYMCNRTTSKTWGKDAWKKIVVCVVSDGRAKINERTKAVLAGLGVYQDGIAKQQVNGKDVTAHVYEYTTQVGLEIKGTQVSLKPRSGTPMQMLFCLKEKNQKKINSHRWFFQAFGRVLDPNVCVLLDAGTKPGKDSIYQLWKAFDLEPMCGGACGEIKVMLDHGKKLYNPLIATQNFEYKMSNILDKPLESAFGFISVLPGAFSAYRYVALQNDKNGEGPLEKYFKGETLHGGDAGVFTANMYLAEDRILCFELVTKRNCRWILQYVKSASGETDVPDGIAEFILQRRRWLNGSFFAAVYAIAHFFSLWRSDHSAMRKFMLLIENVYQTVNMLFAWFAIGNFFLVFKLLTSSLGTKDTLSTAGTILGAIFEIVYIGTLLYCFILAMGNRPQGSRKSYLAMVIFWSLLMVWLTFAAVFLTVRSIQKQVAASDFSFTTVFTDYQFFTIIVSLASTYVLWFVASILFLDPWHMFTCFIQYIVLTPTYINVLNIYAFCNTHDITWGTKGDDKAEKLPSATVKPDGKVDVTIPQDDGDLNAQYQSELVKFATKPPKDKRVLTKADRQEDYYKSFRSTVVTCWMLSNFILVAAVLNVGGFQTINTDPDAGSHNGTIYMGVVLWSVAGLSTFRFVGACWFLVVRIFRGV